MKDDLRTWEAWHTIHQPFELGWWKEHLDWMRDDAAFDAHWAPMREFVSRRGRVLDIGAGPRPPFAPCTVIDPLALEYRRLVPASWWAGCAVYNQPAENLLVGQDHWFDTVMCLNCLDHTIGWRVILANMVQYGAPGARFAVSTDFHPPFVGHPGYPRAEFEAEIGKLFRVLQSRERQEGSNDRELTLLMEAL